MMLKTLLLASALAGATATMAHAQVPPPDGTGPGAMNPGAMGDATLSRTDAQAKAALEFDRLDVDRNGSLSGDELAAMFPEGPMRAMSGMMAHMADTNGDGKISKDEFVAAALHRFDRADANHDGQLTKAERDAERDARRARRHDGMGGGGMGGSDSRPDRPMGRGDGVPMQPPPDDDGQ